MNIEEAKEAVLKECENRGLTVQEEDLLLYDNYVEFANCDYRIGKHINGYSIYCSYYDVIKVWNENDDLVLEFYVYSERKEKEDAGEKEYATFNDIEETILKKYFSS